MKLKLISSVLFYSICILPTACSSDRSENIGEFVFVAFQGFCFRDSTGKIYNIEDVDSLNTSGLYFDSTLLDISRYFEFKNTRIRCVGKPWGKPLEYFEPSSHDTIGLFKHMQLLSASMFTSDYLCSEATGMSDEYGYAFIISRQSESQKHYILYNPACLRIL